MIPGLPYEMVPGLSIELAGVPVGINSLGMRDDEPLAMKGDAVVRIAAVGDSVTFGAGVTQDEAWPSVLERLLNDGALGQGRRYEVLNFGVNGYTSRDEALVARHKVLPLEPDLVVFGYVLNDPEIAPVQPMQAYFREVAWWRHSDLLRLIAHRIHQRAVEKHGGYIEYLHAEEGPGWKSVLRAFGDIVAATGSQDVPVLMIIFPLAIWPKYPHGDIHARVAASAQALGIEVLDLGPVLTDVGAKELRLPEGHPNPLGHRLTAEAVRDWLVENPGVFVVEPARKIEAP